MKLASTTVLINEGCNYCTINEDLTVSVATLSAVNSLSSETNEMRPELRMAPAFAASLRLGTSMDQET